MPILATKLHRPASRSKIVLRPRLVERLNAGSSRGTDFERIPVLTIISAPAGFGKTTLVSDWVANCKWPVGWLSLDEGDNELQRFLIYLVAGLQTIAADAIRYLEEGHVRGKVVITVGTS